MSRLLAVMLALSIAATGCAIGPESRARAIEVSVDGADLGEVDPEIGAGESVAVSSYVVRDNRLLHVTREVSNLGNVAVAVVEMTIAGPTPAEQRSGLWSAVPTATNLAGLDVVDGVATIDLSAEFALIGGLDEVLALGQLVLSLTALTDVRAVTFEIGGTRVSVPLPDGALVARPVNPEDYSELLDR